MALKKAMSESAHCQKAAKAVFYRTTDLGGKESKNQIRSSEIGGSPHCIGTNFANPCSAEIFDRFLF